MASSSSSWPSSSSYLPPKMEDGGYPNWTDLPPELTSLILHRLGAFEMLENAQKVCRSWRSVCKDPSMWRKIEMHNSRHLRYGYELGEMCRHAVDRSEGGLVQIDIWYFATDSLISYIADSASNLRSLKLAMCNQITDYRFSEAVAKLPLLEDLEVTYCCSLSAESMTVVGESCPNLKTLKLNRDTYLCHYIESDDDALAIAATMPRLRHLQLFGNSLTDTGLNAILDHCPNLEHLDLRKCFKVNLAGDLEKRCSERIKVVRQPYDSTHDYPYDDPYDEDDVMSYRSCDYDPDMITDYEGHGYDSSSSDYYQYEDQYDFYVK